MSVSEGCGSYHNVQASTYGDAMAALFPCQSKIDSTFPNQRLFKNVVAQSIEQLSRSGEFTAKPDESRN